MDHGARDGGRATSKGAVHQNRGEDDGGAAHQTPGRTPTDPGQSEYVPGPSTGARPCVYHQQHGEGGGGTTLWRIRAGRNGLSDPKAVASAFWSGERGAAADGSRLRGVVGGTGGPSRLPTER